MSVTETTVVHPEQLLELLNPLNTELWPPGQFVFRGQADASWELVPSSQRRDGPVAARGHHGEKDITCGQQVKFEQDVFRQFLEACDRSGLQVPGDSPLMRQKACSAEFVQAPMMWPPVEIRTALAFAQHHGVPTCLLDWTRRAHVAIYFAASGALNASDRMKPGRPKRHLAIWAFMRPKNGNGVVEAPGGVSPNLAAQSGLFTTTRIWADEHELFSPSRIENERYGQDEGAVLKKYVISEDHAPALLQSCALLAVTGSSLFPGYEGIAKSVRDWASLERKYYDEEAVAIRDL